MFNEMGYVQRKIRNLIENVKQLFNINRDLGYPPPSMWDIVMIGLPRPSMSVDVKYYSPLFDLL